MIKVEGLTKRYARHVAVNNISFEVGKGEIVGFLGKNGAGKTTTMRVLTCFLPPTAGKASVAGFDCVEQPIDVKKNIGYLPETPPVYPDMSIQDYLAFVAQLKGIASAEIPKRVNEVMERTSIGDRRATLIGKLSKGFRQRVGIAQAIIHNPPVLILDEPTSGLDPQQQKDARELIASLSGDHTIILSTHILSEVEQSCSKVIIINAGEIITMDTVENLHKRRSGTEMVTLEVGGATAQAVRQKMEEVRGVARVVASTNSAGAVTLEVEGMENFLVRPELAKAVVQSGWSLLEMRTVGASLEEIFLDLTKAEKKAPVAEESK